MLNKKILAMISISLLFLFSGCDVFPLAKQSNGTSLRLAHNQGLDHPVHQSLKELSTRLGEDDSPIHVEIFPNGQLGQERAAIEMVQAGVLDFAKVNAAALEAFDSNYQILSLPYIFSGEEHFYKMMDESDVIQEIFKNSKQKGFFALTWYDAGARSIYLREDKQLSSPADLAGKKIRVQESPTAIEMINAMGGSATPMSYGEVFTGIQQGIVDGAENNTTALTTGKHAEVSKSMTLTEHQYSADILIVSTKTWEDKLTEKQQQQIIHAAKQSTQSHKQRWNQSITESMEQSKKMGMTFYTIDKQPFIQATQAIRDKFANKNPTNERFVKAFE